MFCENILINTAAILSRAYTRTHARTVLTIFKIIFRALRDMEKKKIGLIA